MRLKTIVGITTVSVAVRWSKNNLTEVLGNYHRELPPELRDKIREAITALSEADELFPSLDEASPGSLEESP